MLERVEAKQTKNREWYISYSFTNGGGSTQTIDKETTMKIKDICDKIMNGKLEKCTFKSPFIIDRKLAVKEMQGYKMNGTDFVIQDCGKNEKYRWKLVHFPTGYTLQNMCCIKRLDCFNSIVDVILSLDKKERNGEMEKVKILNY